MNKKNIFFYLLVIISFIVLAIIVPKIYFQNDTFYSIKIGNSILKNGIDMKDHFSWISNLTYVYPHWLFDVIIYVIFRFFGYFGIYIFTITSFFVLLMLMFKYCSNITKDKYLSFLLVFFIGITLRSSITARAQLLTYILLLTILFIIDKLKDGKRIHYMLLFLCSLLVANLHVAVWPFIFVLFLPYIVSDLIFILCKKLNFDYSKVFNLSIEKSSLKNYFKGIIACVIPGFLTPNFLVPFTYLIKTEMGISPSRINEHLPINISDSPATFIILFIVVILLLTKKTKVKLSDFFLLSGLFLLSFSSVRNYSLLVILGSIPLCRLLNNNKIVDLELILLNKLFYVCFCIIFVVAFIVSICTTEYEFIDENTYPVKAADYILDVLDVSKIKLFNEYNYGSYLMLRGIPVFIDSRADLYLEEFNEGCTIFREFTDMYGDYDYVIRKYGATHVLISDSNKVSRLIKLDDGYKRIYFDTHFDLYEVIY